MLGCNVSNNCAAVIQETPGLGCNVSNNCVLLMACHVQVEHVYVVLDRCSAESGLELCEF